MHALPLVASSLLLISTLGSSVFAQAKKGPAPAPAPAVRYFQFSGDLLGDLPIDAFLREVRQGGKVVAAVLDVCHSIENAEPRKDRFVVELKAEADRLTGSGRSQEENVPVSVDLGRRQNGPTVSFTGSITLDRTRMDADSADNTDMSEDEFRENQPAEESIVAAPADFTEVSPGSIAIRVARESLTGVVNELKRVRAAVELESLIAGCATLRSGEHIVRATVDPERASALVARLKGLPGVAAAGWTNGDYIVDYAVRLDGAGWRGADGTPDRSRLASSIADSLARALTAKVDAATWDDASGELSLRLSRPSLANRQLELTDVFELAAAVGPEKPGAAGLIVWLRYKGLDTVDRGPEPRLRLAPIVGDREGPTVSLEDIVSSLARDLNGRYWDAASSAWQ
jgi:hypothetical protein